MKAMKIAPMTRRGFIVKSLVGAATVRTFAATLGTPRVTIDPSRMFLPDCSLPGETRADGWFAAHPNGIRLSRDRFLLLYATRGWRGVDDNHSIIYQVRADGFDGRVIKEGILAASRDDWDALGDGQRHAMSRAHPTAFGVPKRSFAQSNRRVVLDARSTIPGIRTEAYLMADQAKVLPHTGGREQMVLHRVRTWSIDYDVPDKGPALLPHEKFVQGIYCARLKYDQAYPDPWDFGPRTTFR